MAKKPTHKNVIIPTVGPIYPKGGINGPITTPYREEVRTIGTLLLKGYDVVEVLPNFNRVNLTLSNFENDHTPKGDRDGDLEDVIGSLPAQSVQQVQAPVTPEEPAKEESPEQVDVPPAKQEDEKDQEPAEPAKEEAPKQQQHQHQSKKDKKKNRVQADDFEQK